MTKIEITIDAEGNAIIRVTEKGWNQPSVFSYEASVRDAMISFIKDLLS